MDNNNLNSTSNKSPNKDRINDPYSDDIHADNDSNKGSEDKVNITIATVNDDEG